MDRDDPELFFAEQQVSIDILLEKYAKGEERSSDDVRRRVAHALAAVEQDPARWQGEFLAALKGGFIPGGRVNSAAGTDLEATLINCFVQPVGDSVSQTVEGKPGIYVALMEAAETMRRGGGVGYDFSSIRPKGAYVRGTHSSASGPVSYMRVFDRSCETVESAGSRRGAQMGILRCDHPDIEEFIHAKDKGDLRNFNVSVAVTDAFMHAVEAGSAWELVHQAAPGAALAPDARQRGDGAWVYRSVPARELWQQVMQSTYHHAEPGVVFIDRIIADNNLSYCERIESTNPCVTADTWTLTTEGPRQVRDLVGRPFHAIVDGRPYKSGTRGFFSTGIKPVIEINTAEGMRIKLTAGHKILRVERLTRYVRHTKWVPAGELIPGDKIVVNNHRAFSGWEGRGNKKLGYLMGFLIGDGTLKHDSAVLSVWATHAATANGADIVSLGASSLMQAVEDAASSLRRRSDHDGWHRVAGRNEYRYKLSSLRDLAFEFGLSPGDKPITPAIESTSSEFHRGFLRALFDTDGSAQGTQSKGVSIRLAHSDLARLEAVQRMLLRLGIASVIYKNRRAPAIRSLPNGRGGNAGYQCLAQHELIIANDNVVHFADWIGFADHDKAARLKMAVSGYRRTPNAERFVATIESAMNMPLSPVFDAQIAHVHAFDANGLYVHNCGEQPLPAYGCCCLGSINLTRFVSDPFTPQARFDFAAFGRVVRPAVRMLDNVLDVTVWPLPQQQAEARASCFDRRASIRVRRTMSTTGSVMPTMITPTVSVNPLRTSGNTPCGNCS